MQGILVLVSVELEWLPLVGQPLGVKPLESFQDGMVPLVLSPSEAETSAYKMKLLAGAPPQVLPLQFPQWEW